MKTFVMSAALAIGVSMLGFAAHAFPLSFPVQSPSSGIVQIRDGCGVGWHRGPYGYCWRNGVPYVYGPYAVYGPPAPHCWWVATPHGGSRRVCAW